MNQTLEITRLGAQGDGIAEAAGGQIFVPFTLPGETVTADVVKDRGELIKVLETSPQRVAPACRHFGVCGGCVLQHLEEASYREWKRDKVVQALRGRRIEVPVDELVTCLPHTRRRAVFTARRTEGGVLLGFNQALSHTIVAIEECPVLVPAIVERLDTLRELAGLVSNTAQPFRMTVTHTASGLDVAVHEAGTLSDPARRTAIAFAVREGLARLSIDGEIAVEPSKPQLDVGAIPVAIPPGGFLQAVEAAEEAMGRLALGHLVRAKKVADLYSGFGAFALRLAAKSEVHAVEADAASLASLDRAFRFATGLRRVTVERRDLERRPLTWKELNAFDGVVFDPPRAGAEDQARQIARSDVPRVVAVSCNPVTLARDLSILLEGGYAVKRVTPIDQFLWSAHVEAVALLEKPKKRR